MPMTTPKASSSVTFKELNTPYYTKDETITKWTSRESKAFPSVGTFKDPYERGRNHIRFSRTFPQLHQHLKKDPSTLLIQTRKRNHYAHELQESKKFSRLIVILKC
ncbi:hypothetical protein AVEN_261444-1 [Araneus ventricosus]|uniref:Uncharacterized protein n=1 Tax=Araneus ventricosus TaxID=182803 RepID=A0A4Y2V943_ARAVE|nr:hypothetical protein AVEN_261444-1 [Araneus ventricosus]